MMTKARVCILDYGCGNVKSVYNLVSTLDAEVTVSNAPQAIADASHLVLPGVGAFGRSMDRIRELLPMADLQSAVQRQGKPFLGICVGMQVLAVTGREFGEHPGLGWVPGEVRQLETAGMPLPHVGWNNIRIESPTPLLEGLGESPDFYFVHSFALRTDAPGLIAATAEYGQRFPAVIAQGNLYGVQFHPEKSQRPGIRLFKNFLALS